MGVIGLSLAATCASAALAAAAIDRRAVVARHAPTAAVPLSPWDVFSVGNGAFAFNVDASGLQSLNATYAAGDPGYDVQTLADWAAHSTPFSDAHPDGALTAYRYTNYVTPTGPTTRRTVPYPTNGNVSAAVADWLHSNPHRLNLAQVALVRDGGGAGAPTASLRPSDLGNVSTSLDAWAGAVASAFTLPGGPAVSVSTVAHPDIDAFSTRVACAPSPAGGCPLAVRVAFPYARGGNPSASAWASADDGRHGTALLWNKSDAGGGGGRFGVSRTLDADGYVLACTWAGAGGGGWALSRPTAHVLELRAAAPASAASGAALELACVFAPRGADGAAGGAPAYPVGASQPWLVAKAAATAPLVAPGVRQPLPAHAAVAAAAAAAWAAFWSDGAFVELDGGGGGAAAAELQRRVVLSLYLTRVHSAGAAPPAETGLLCNSWGGKHHSEMRFWHQAHWALWGRAALAHRTDGFYSDLLQNATAAAAAQGYAGARWPKMTLAVSNRSGGMDVPGLGRPPAPGAPNLMLWESVNTINPFLVWHQPHVVWMAEAQRRAALATGGAPAAAAVVTFHAPLVAATAAFLASFPHAGADGLLRLGAPIMGGEEEGAFGAIDTPTFERTYFAWALDVANEWRVTQGLPPDSAWAAAAGGFAPPAVDPAAPPGAPVYAPNANASCCLLPPGSPLCAPGRYGGKAQCAPLESHPLFVGILGMIDGRARGDRYGVDVGVANRTLAGVLADWHWGANPADGANVWGWDFGLVALAAARLGWAPDAVVGALLRDVPKNFYTRLGHNSQRAGLRAYLPGNGATLLAVAALAADFSGNGTGVAGTGFPPAWRAVAEGFPIPYP